MALSDSSRVEVGPNASDDPHPTTSAYHRHTSDADFGGPSDVNPISAVNPIESRKLVSTIVESRHTLHGFEIQTLDSRSTSGNVVLSSGSANISEHSLSFDTTSTGTTPSYTEHQQLQFIRFETKGILCQFYVNCDSFNDILVCSMFTIILCCK
ncbi:hypothetical protein Hanom_Chr12g01109191 [Helianthus anomalus]